MDEGELDQLALYQKKASFFVRRSKLTIPLSFRPGVSPSLAKPVPLDKGFLLGAGGVDFVAAGCLKAFRISVGTKLRVERHTETAGGCSPFVYQVMTLYTPDDIEKCVAYCR